jgi:hypothetical protein
VVRRWPCTARPLVVCLADSTAAAAGYHGWVPLVATRSVRAEVDEGPQRSREDSLALADVGCDCPRWAGNQTSAKTTGRGSRSAAAAVADVVVDEAAAVADGFAGGVAVDEAAIDAAVVAVAAIVAAAAATATCTDSESCRHFLCDDAMDQNLMQLDATRDEKWLQSQSETQSIPCSRSTQHFDPPRSDPKKSTRTGNCRDSHFLRALVAREAVALVNACLARDPAAVQQNCYDGHAYLETRGIYQSRVRGKSVPCREGPGVPADHRYHHRSCQNC